jgi:hypothetical protein
MNAGWQRRQVPVEKATAAAAAVVRVVESRQAIALRRAKPSPSRPMATNASAAGSGVATNVEFAVGPPHAVLLSVQISPVTVIGDPTTFVVNVMGPVGKLQVRAFPLNAAPRATSLTTAEHNGLVKISVGWTRTVPIRLGVVALKKSSVRPSVPMFVVIDAVSV